MEIVETADTGDDPRRMLVATEHISRVENHFTVWADGEPESNARVYLKNSENSWIVKETYKEFCAKWAQALASIHEMRR